MLRCLYIAFVDKSWNVKTGLLSHAVLGFLDQAPHTWFPEIGNRWGDAGSCSWYGWPYPEARVLWASKSGFAKQFRLQEQKLYLKHQSCMVYTPKVWTSSIISRKLMIFSFCLAQRIYIYIYIYITINKYIDCIYKTVQWVQVHKHLQTLIVPFCQIKMFL